MPDDRTNPSWFPSWLPDFFPRDSPTIHEQLQCPPGQHRDFRGGRTGVCVPDQARGPMPGTIVEIPEAPTPAPPRPGRVPRPPKVPSVEPPSTPPPSSPSSSPVDRTTGRYFPRGRAEPLPSLFAVPAILGWVLGALVIGPYFGYGNWDTRAARPSPTGPPRRTRRPPGPASDVPPYYRYEGPWPYQPGMPMPGPLPLPRRTPRVPARPGDFVDPTTGAPLPTPRDRTVPRTGSPVSPLPAEWPLGSPLPGPGYDPFTRAPAPAPAPRPAPRTRPGGRTGPALSFPFPVPWGIPGVAPGYISDPLTRQPTPRPQPTPRTPATPRPRLPPAPRLTPIDQPGAQSLPRYLGQPKQANPCTAERTTRRRRQRDCKKFTTKTIRVCADK